MKALILAAGFGTRLLPHTSHTPKPLFTLAGKTMLEITINNLRAAGCSRIVVNTHHLHGRMENFLVTAGLESQVFISHEPEILGTGGAIKKVRSIMGDEPFFVVNSDILSCVDLEHVRDFHLRGDWPVTLVLSDTPPLNRVWVTGEGVVKGFTKHGKIDKRKLSPLAFTGIQVISPSCLDDMPDTPCFSSIDFYDSLCQRGDGVRGYIDSKSPWADMGTPESYHNLALSSLAFQVMGRGGPKASLGDNGLTIEALAGDGSDRGWYRAGLNGQTVIIADHGIVPKKKGTTREVDSFVNIGRHLTAKNLPVPEILFADLFSGLVALEDLGEIHLQDIILSSKNRSEIIEIYKKITELLFDFSFKGGEGFDPAWTHQTPSYSREVILENECRYFLDAFINNYLGNNIKFSYLDDEFNTLASGALDNSLNGLIHRDFQSRNIMVTNGSCCFIDFQGGRLGPLQYDLASLLLDPYVRVDYEIQEEILTHGTRLSHEIAGFDGERFQEGYRFCRITRNLQILGAFSYLTMVKGKSLFEKYIPASISSLKEALPFLEARGMPRLVQLIKKI